MHEYFQVSNIPNFKKKDQDDKKQLIIQTISEIRVWRKEETNQ